MKRNFEFSTIRKVFFTIIFIVAYLFFIEAMNLKAGSANVHQSKEIVMKNSENEFSEKNYQQVESPLTPEEINIIISFGWILFGWLVRFIEKRKIKRKLKRQLKNSATSKNVSLNENEFDKVIDEI